MMSQQLDKLQESQANTSEQVAFAKNLTKNVSVMNCPNCDYSSTNKHYLRQHIDLVHATERPFKCPFCDYAGKRSHSLKEHLIVHSDERPYTCTHCNAKFRKKGHLTNHYRMHAESQSKPVCPLCKSSAINFATHDELYLHLRSAHASRRDTGVFWCNRCSYATTVKGNLHIHEMGHNDYRHVVLMKPKLPPSTSIILKCSECGFETSQRQELETHVMERHFDGDQRLFNKDTDASEQIPTVIPRSQVGSHLTGVPKFKCTDCGFVTADTSQLLAHALQHKLSSSAGNLADNSALNKRVPEKVADVPALQIDGSYVCSICSYFCDTQRTLKAHMWKHLGHKNLQYPTFQNGPLSVYDDTPLAAKHFVCSPPSVQQSSVTGSVVHNNARPLENYKRRKENAELDKTIKEARSPLDYTTSSRASSPTNYTAVSRASSPKRVVVQNIQQVSDMNTTCYSLEVNEETMTEESIKIHNMDNNVGCDLSSSDEVISPGESSKRISTAEQKLDVAQPPVIAKGSAKMDTSCYSATEKTAATLLSLLRQGPNINPACPPAGHYYEMRNATEKLGQSASCGSDSAIVEDVAGEEVVGTDFADSASVDSCQTSGPHSVGKPKKGICSSLLAVIEQLRERQADEQLQASATRGRRKRKLVTQSEKNISEVEALAKGIEEEEEAGEVVYRCKACDHSTSSVKDMQRHINLHVDQSNDVDVCPTDFSALLNVDGSLPAADSIVYRCKLCHYRSSAHLMRQHMKIHKTKKRDECSLCDFVASSTSALQDHMIQHCKMRQFQCKICSTVFNYKSQLRAHTRVHEDGQAFYCDHCEYVTSYIDSFQDHLNLHSEVISYFTCIACRKVFSDLVMLQTHMKESCEEVKRLHKANPLLTSQTSSGTRQSDSTSRTLKCDQCEFVALSIRSLKSHLKRHINDKRYIQQPLEQYKCNLCGYVCHHMPSLKSHMWRHANDSQFSYSFNDLLDETAVDKTGTPLITLRCCQCGYETLQKCELDKHMKTHWDIIKKTFDVGSNVSSCE